MNLSAVPLAPTAPDGAIPTKRLTGLQIGLMALLISSAVINYVDRQAMAVVSTLLMEQFHMSKQTYGWVNSVFSGTYILASALGGLWIDRVGVRRGLFLATIFWTLAAAAHSLVTGFVSLCVVRVLLAIGEGPGGAALLKGVRLILPPRLQDTGVSLIGVGTLLGAVLAPLTIAPLASIFGWRAAFLVTAALGFIWLPFWLLANARKDANLDAEVVETPARPHQGLDFSSVAVWATAVAIFFSIAPTVFTLAFLPSFLKETYGVDLKQLGSIAWQPSLAMDIGQLLGGFALYALLSRGFSPLVSRRVVMTSGMLGASSMLMMLQSHDLGHTMLWLNISRFCFQFAYSGLLAYGITAVPERQGGAMNGFMNATFGLCNFVFSPLIGWVADKWNYQAVLLMVGVMPVIALVFWWILSEVAARQQASRLGTTGRRIEPQRRRERREDREK